MSEAGGSRRSDLVRNDPLGDRLARGRIDQAQYLAGREFQKHFRMAEQLDDRLPRSEAIDDPSGRLTDAQLKAWAWLSKCYRRLGSDGGALINDMLIRNMTTGQVAASQGQGCGMAAVLRAAI